MPSQPGRPTTSGKASLTVLLQSHGTDTGTGARARARWRARLAAFHLAAECEHLLDELNRAGTSSEADAIGRALLATRAVVALTADPSTAEQLFDPAGQPSIRLRDAQRRILDALGTDIGRESRTAGDPVGPAVDNLRAAARGLFSCEARPVSQPAAVAGPARVLIVDDQPLMVNLLRRAVIGLSHEAVTASNGVDALETALAGGIDLVLSDIEMPGMDGLELLRRLKSDDRTRRIPVIVISSLDDMENVARCIELGAEDHIAKPFQSQILNARVKASIDRKRLHDEESAHLSGVSRLIVAAEAVEAEVYDPRSLEDLTARADGLGKLARIFDRMVGSLRSREDRLRHRIQHLRNEVSAASSGITVARRRADDAIFGAGAVVADRYELRGQIGEGGMGTVYVAFDRQLGLEIALKSVRADLVEEDPTLVSRLKSEILLARRISHPNVVRSHDHGQWQGHHFITMELVKGISLAELLDQRGRLTAAAALAIGTQLCDALATAHEAEIIHRDIKPANLLIDDAGLLKVMDFGIARSLGTDHEGHTGRGHVIGTPRYMAPEVMIGGAASPKMDLFAVGVVLYESLTGGVPYYAETPAEMVNEIFRGSAPPVDASGDVPAEFARLIHQQLSYDPARRAASARELAARLAEIEIAPVALRELDSR